MQYGFWQGVILEAATSPGDRKYLDEQMNRIEIAEFYLSKQL